MHSALAFFGIPNEEVDIGPQNVLQGVVGNVSGMVPLGQEMCNEIGPVVVQLVGFAVHPWGAAVAGKDGGMEALAARAGHAGEQNGRPSREIMIEQGCPGGRQGRRPRPDVGAVGPQQLFGCLRICAEYACVIPDTTPLHTGAEELPPGVNRLGAAVGADLRTGKEGMDGATLSEGALLLPNVEPCGSIPWGEVGARPSDTPQPLQ